MSVGDASPGGLVGHLVRRFAGSWSRTPPMPADVAWVRGVLAPSEMELWSRLSLADRRHSIAVARRFEDGVRSSSGQVPPTAALAGALLHDIGKLDAHLGTLGRVAATLVGRRGDRFRRYHDHERIGAAWLADRNSDPLTIALVARRPGTPFVEELAWADDL